MTNAYFCSQKTALAGLCGCLWLLCGGAVAGSGPGAPLDGQSLFDDLFLEQQGDQGQYRIPYPFDAVIARIDRALGKSVNGDGNTARSTLVPLGRCINREAASPDFFAFPRIIAAVDSEPWDGESRDSEPQVNEPWNMVNAPYLRDRLYIGYQEKANAMEIISYNDHAGRFEFQVVTDYAEGKSPKVSYVERSTCTGCHQNQGPIFPRPPWNETESNRDIFDLLAASRRSTSNEPVVYRGSDAAYIDGSTNRANKLSLYQSFWKGICQPGNELGGMPESGQDAVQCRAGLFEMVILHRLQQRNRVLPLTERMTTHVLPQAMSRIHDLWPDGISVPSSDIPNENPLENGAIAHMRLATELQQARSLMIKWQPDNMLRMVEGLGEFIPTSAIRQLDRKLYQLSSASPAATVTLQGICQLRLIKQDGEQAIGQGQSGDILVKCDFSDGGVSRDYHLLGDLFIESGEIASLPIFSRLILDTGKFILGLTHSGGRVETEQDHRVIRLNLLDSKQQLHARLPAGGIIDELEIRWHASEQSDLLFNGSRSVSATAMLGIIPDYDVLDAAISGMVASSGAGGRDYFSAAPFNGGSMIKALINELGRDSEPELN